MVKNIKRLRKQPRRRTKRISKRYTPEIMMQLRSMPTFPDGRPNPLYMNNAPNGIMGDSAQEYRLRLQTQKLSEIRGENVNLSSVNASLKEDIDKLHKDNDKQVKENRKLLIEKELLAKQAKEHETQEELLKKLGLYEHLTKLDEMAASNKDFQKEIEVIKKQLDSNRMNTAYKELEDKNTNLKFELTKLHKELTEADTIDVYQLQKLQNEYEINAEKLKIAKEKRKLEIQLNAKKQLLNDLKKDPSFRLGELEKHRNTVRLMEEEYNNELELRKWIREYTLHFSQNRTTNFQSPQEYLDANNIKLPPEYVKKFNDTIKYEKPNSDETRKAFKEALFKIHNDTSSKYDPKPPEKLLLARSELENLESIQNNENEVVTLQNIIENNKQQLDNYNKKIAHIMNMRTKHQELEDKIEESRFEYITLKNLYPEADMTDEFIKLSQQSNDIRDKLDRIDRYKSLKKDVTAKTEEFVMKTGVNLKMADRYIDGIKNTYKTELERLAANKTREELAEKMSRESREILRIETGCKHLKDMIETVRNSSGNNIDPMMLAKAEISLKTQKKISDDIYNDYREIVKEEFTRNTNRVIVRQAMDNSINEFIKSIQSPYSSYGTDGCDFNDNEIRILKSDTFHIEQFNDNIVKNLYDKLPPVFKR